MARISRVGLGWTAPERIDWYANVEDWYNAERLIDYGSLIEAACKGDCTQGVTGTDFTVDAPHGAWIYADPSVYYDFTNESVIPFIGEDTVVDAFDIRISGIMLKTTGVSAGFEPLTTNNKRTIVEDCRIMEINPAGTSYGVQINGAGSQANQDIISRCVVSRANLSNATELIKQTQANGYGAVRNCVLISGAGKYADGSNNVGLEVTDCVGLGSAGYDATSLILNTSSSEDTSGTAGLTLIDSSALSDFAGDDFRSKSGGALDVAGTNTPYIGVGLDAVAGDAILLTPFSTTGRYIFNRELSGAERSINVSVNLTGDPSGGIEWRLVDNSTGLPIAGHDWSNFLTNPAVGAHTVAVDVPTSTGLIWYKLQLRFTSVPAVATESVLEFAVGCIVVDNGQSNCIYREERTDNPPTVHADAVNCTLAGWQTTFPLGNGAIAKVNELITLLNMPVGYFNNGSISKAISYFETGVGWVNLSGIVSNHFDNYFELMCMDQGEADALIPTSAAGYQASNQAILDNLLTQMNRPASEFTFCVNLGGNSNGYNTGTYTDATLEGVRDGKRAFVAANDGAIWGGHRIDLPLGDSIHTQTPFYEVAAEREVKSYSVHLGLSSVTGDGRSISSAQVAGNQLTVNYSAGDALTKIGPGAATMTQVSGDDFSSLIAITDTVVNTDSVVHTLASTPSGEVKLRDYYGIDLDVTTRPVLIFPSSATSSVTSTFLMTDSDVPDGTIEVDFYNATTKLLISTQVVTFFNGASNSELSAPVDTRVFAFKDSSTPLTSGICYVGVTE